jgi:hypothetical protein
VTAVFGGLVAHSAVRRGPARTAFFFLWALGFFEYRAALDLDAAHDLEYDLHVRFWEHRGLDLGGFLVVVPALRVSAAYLGLCIGEWVVARLGPRRRGFFQTLGFSVLGHSLVRVAIECTVTRLGWWTWKPVVDDPGPVPYFIMWLTWAVGFFESFLLYFIEWKAVRRTWLLSVFYLVGWIGLLYVLWWIDPGLERIAYNGLGFVIICLGFMRGGPALRPIRLPAH